MLASQPSPYYLTSNIKIYRSLPRSLGNGTESAPVQPVGHVQTRVGDDRYGCTLTVGCVCSAVSVCAQCQYNWGL